MSQHDLDIANQGFAAFRADLNNALKALGSLSSGATAPATPFANQLWYETDTNILHIRDETNSSWLDLMVIDQTTGSPSFTAGNVGIGTTSPGQRLQVQGSAFADTVLRISTASGATGNFKRLEFTDNAGGTVTGSITSFGSAQGSGNDSDMAFAVNGSERLRIDSSGNVGIGTSAPSTNLHVNQTGATPGEYGIRVGQAGFTSNFGAFNIDTTGIRVMLESSGIYPIAFDVNGTERMRIDSSGNLGLGVTPSAWGSNFTAIEAVDNSAVVFASANVNPVTLAGNVYNNGTNWLYKTTGAAALYEAGNVGAHKWYIAPSGTAGNAITFTQAMTLDASGNLVLGTTSASARLHVVDAAAASSSPSVGVLLSRSGANAGEKSTAIQFDVGGGGGQARIYTERLVGFGANLIFAPADTSGAFPERARIHASGGVSIGSTTDPGAGNLLLSGSVFSDQPAPTAKTATATLTIAEILTDIITVTSATAVSLTLPTGTLTDAGIMSGALPVNGSFDWSIINLGSSSGAVTMVAGTGHTYVGNATVAISTSAQFRTRKTAANTYVTYRIS